MLTRIGIGCGSLALLVAFPVRADTHYVWTNSPSPAAPYLSWASAARSIQEAVDRAAEGDTVLVRDGVYDVGATVAPGAISSNRVAVTRIHRARPLIFMVSRHESVMTLKFNRP